MVLVWVRWFAAYPLSLRHQEAMMAEQGGSVDHSAVHRWALKVRKRSINHALEPRVHA